MYELMQVTEHCYYVQCPAKIGIVKLNEKEVCLIDSGNDKDAGKKVLKLLNANGWSLKAIYNTHSNADHIGGNRFLQEKTGCEIYAPGIEQAFTKYPILEPSYLYGGFPPKALRHKFLLAQPSEAKELTKECLPEGFEIVPLPGHFFDMVGFRTPDDVVYLADCLSSKETLEKYQIGVLYDVESYIKTLEMVKNMKAKLFIPSHAAPCEDVVELAQYNIDTVYSIADKIEEFCEKPTCFDMLLRRVFEEYKLKISMEQHVLIGSTVRSYLSWLMDQGRIEAYFEDNLLLWEKVRG